MITLKSCPICDDRRFTQYRAVAGFILTYEVVPGAKVTAPVITYYYICQNCHLIFQNPRLSDLELDKFYGQGYYRRIIDMTDEQMDSNEASRAKIDAEIVKQHIGKVIAHLDIGCSRGFLLEAVGANVKVGVEPNVGYVKVRGVEVYPEMKQVPQKSFDLVTTIHVLEHVPAPLDYLQSMTKFVSKGGYLVIEVPSWETPGGPFGFPHLYHFEPDVLKHMCALAGLHVIHEQLTPHLMLICKVDHN